MLFKNYTAFIQNMSTFIDGPKSPYGYKTRITNTDLIENTTFTVLRIHVYDIQETIVGSGKEKFEVWFDDLSVIQDQANNSLSDGKIVGNLNTYIYIPIWILQSTETSGSGFKYTIISLFSINMLIKLFVSSTASLMWNMIHVLQVLRLILMIDIQMPRLISMTIDYLEIVIGEIEELEDVVPDPFNEYIIDSEQLNENAFVPDNLEKHGYEKPYLTDLYGKQFIIIAGVFILLVPSAFLLMHSCK